MSRKLHPTLADYIVIAISPALIMTLVGSLVYFLLAVLYQGQFSGRLHWVMACFVFAAVLISRISIEEGWERAAPFGIALAIVVGIAANRFMEVQGGWLDQISFLINWSLIALIWWSAHRLTWDCTVTDEREDASGEGLLQVAGLERRPGGDSADAGAAAPDQPARAVEGTTSREVPTGWWQRYVENQRRPHAPGVWVVYFSLAALPLFGVGQWFIPASNVAARRWAFFLLLVYVASGLALLLTTSFLGLRRYLRQRRLEMPTLMANLWLASGGAIIVALLALAALLPRPSAEYSIAELPFALGSPTNKASRLAPVPREGTQDEQSGSAPDDKPREGDATPPDSHEQNSSTGTTGDGNQQGASDQSRQPGGQSKDDSQSQSTSNDRGKGGQSKSDNSGKSQDAKSDQGKQDPKGGEKAGSEKSGPEKAGSQKSTSDKSNSDKSQKSPESQSAKNDSSRQSSQPSQPKAPQAPALPNLSSVANLVKLVIYGIVALVVLFLLWRHRAEVWRALCELLAALRDLLSGAWGGKRKDRAKAAGDAPELALPLVPFASFANPFEDPELEGQTDHELVQYSFEAFEAWSREHGHARQPDETAHELAREVGKQSAYIAADSRNLAELHARAAYDRRELPSTTRDQLRKLWRQMQANPAEPQWTVGLAAGPSDI